MTGAGFIGNLKNGGNIEADESVFHAIWGEYEKVILESLVTSFGLDVLIHDKKGGDVDTILNVRKIAGDPELEYKNFENKINYDNRDIYDKNAYHSDKRYKSIVH